MNKRGQMYILAAIVLSIAIFSVMKVTNKFVSPAEDNFDFFVENLEGERSYVMNLGLLKDEGESHYLKGGGGVDSLLEIFQDFGINTGIVLVEYTDQWVVTNYLGDPVNIGEDCEGCDSFSLPPAGDDVADVSFSMNKGGKRWNPEGQWDTPADYFTKTFGTQSTLTISINENNYVFSKPSSGNKVESIVFRNIGENYVRVVHI